MSLLSAPRADEEDVETGEIGIGGIGEEGGHIEEGDEEHRSGDDLRGRARSKSTGEQGQSGKGQLDLKIRTVEVKGDVELPD